MLLFLIDCTLDVYIPLRWLLLNYISLIFSSYEWIPSIRNTLFFILTLFSKTVRTKLKINKKTNDWLFRNQWDKKYIVSVIKINQ